MYNNRRETMTAARSIVEIRYMFFTSVSCWGTIETRNRILVWWPGTKSREKEWTQRSFLHVVRWQQKGSWWADVMKPLKTQSVWYVALLHASFNLQHVQVWRYLQRTGRHKRCYDDARLLKSDVSAEAQIHQVKYIRPHISFCVCAGRGLDCSPGRKNCPKVPHLHVVEGDY